jgi:DNA repair protein SbcC/Rad50
LIAQALQWEKKAAENEAQSSARARSLRTQQAEQKRVGVSILQTQTALKVHDEALDTWHARLFLPSGSASETVKARLEELDALARQSSALNDARQSQGHHHAMVSDIESRAAQLAMVVGAPEPASVDDFADRLRRRLVASRENEQARTTLIREQRRAQQKKLEAEAELGQQDNVLVRLCSAARVTTADMLPEREESAARKRHAQIRLSTLREQLAQASARPEQALRESLAGQDAVAIESERARCKLEIGQREAEQVAARQIEEQARRALEAIDTSDRAAAAREGMESAAAKFRAGIRPWARLKLAHALLSESLNRFRERAQAPMVAAASTYFSLMTGGRYERLEADEEGDKPVLRAVQADGTKKGIEAMSEGTSDQLYLALRLAALDLRRASHQHMPLVLDDVLITSDDERAANVLRALARFAEGGQVMIFTHHRHLIDVARAALGDHALTVHSL